MTPPSRIAELAVPVLRYLAEDSRLIMLLLDNGLMVRDANQGFVHLLGLDAPPRGMPLAELLAAGENDRVGQAVQTHSPAEVVLRFLDRRGKEVGIRARLIVLDEGLLLFGEEFVLSEAEVLSEMSRLNNELANTARELHRKNQALERARDKIKTLSGLLP
ncbi:MAG: PAS domain-containing protein, partial [Desulfohalobiaceae bacterium]